MINRLMIYRLADDILMFLVDVYIGFEDDCRTFRPGLGIEVDEAAVRKFHVPIKN